MTNYKPRVLVDFDATIHLYSKGWFDGTAYDVPMAGAKEALQELKDKGYEVVIFSTRNSDQIYDWFERHNWGDVGDLWVTNEKLPAVAIIDDRAIHHIDWYTSLNELYERYPIKEGS